MVGVHAQQLHLALQAAEGGGVEHARIIAHAFLAAGAASVGLGMHAVLQRQHEGFLFSGEGDGVV